MTPNTINLLAVAAIIFAVLLAAVTIAARRWVAAAMDAIAAIGNDDGERM